MPLFTLATSLIIIHLCAFTRSAVITLPSALSPTLQTFHSLTNTSIPTNTTDTDLDFSFHHRPPTDPYTFLIPPTLTIKVSTYGAPIPELDIITTLLHANIAAIAALESTGDVVVAHNLAYESGTARMELVPTRLLTWGVWAQVLRGLGAFVRRWEAMEFVFTVAEGGVEVGIGVFGRV